MRVYLSVGTAEHLDADALRRALHGQRPDLEVLVAARRNETGVYLTRRLHEAIASADVVVMLIDARLGAWQELEYFEAHQRLRAAGRPALIAVQIADRLPALPGLSQVRCLDARALGLADVVASILSPGEPGPAPDWRSVMPYAGLSALEAQDSAFFLGRELAVTRLLGALSVSPNRIHVLVGNSGVGKSTLLSAGVLAALRSQMWPVAGEQPWPESLADSRAWPLVRTRPGARPLLSLARAFVSLWRESPGEIEEEAARWSDELARGGRFAALLEAALSRVAFRMDAEPPWRLVLCVDQAEELYALASKDEQHAFSRLMAEAAASDGALVLMALRADAYGALQADAALYPVVRTTDLASPEPALIEALVRRPAERLGVVLASEEAVEQVVAAAARTPGGLPLLVDHLADRWARMQGAGAGEGVLPLQPGFVDIARPLIDRGERFVATRPGDEETLRRLFTLRLAVLPRASEVIARRSRRSECSDEEWSLLEALAAAPWRLVRLAGAGDAACAELAHEIVLRAWPRVRAWLDDSREFMAWKHRFEADYRRWEEAGEAVRSSTLLSGLPLDVACRWRSERPADLSPGERLFIDESGLATAAAGEAAIRAERRLVRQRRWTMGLVLAALVAVAGLAIMTLEQRRDAEALARREQLLGEQARQQREAALEKVDRLNATRLALEAGRLLEGEGGTRLPLLLAAESLRLAPTADGILAMRRALAQTPEPGQPLPWKAPPLRMSSDGRVVVFGELDGPPALQVGRHQDGEQETLALAATGALAGLQLSDDGRWLAGIDTETRQPVVWDTLSGARHEGEADVLRLAFADGGDLLLAGRPGRRLSLLASRDGRPIADLGLAAGVRRVTMAADGRSLVSFGDDGRFRGWDGPTGRSLWVSREARPLDTEPILSGNGEWFAQRAPESAQLVFGDVASGRVERTLPVDGGGEMRLSHDGSRLLWFRPTAGGTEGELQLWDTARAVQLHRRPLRGAEVDAGFLPGGRLITLAVRPAEGEAGTGYLELIDGAGGDGLWRLDLPAGAPPPIGMDAGLLALPGSDGVRLLTRAGELSFDLGGGRPVVAATADPAGRWLALARDAGVGRTRIEWRERVRGELQHTLEVDGQVVRLLAGPPGASLLAVVRRGEADWLLAWDGAEGRRLGGLPVADGVADALVLPGDRRVAVLDRQGQLGIHRLVGDGGPVARLVHQAVADDWVASSRAPEAVVRVGRTLQWWDLEQPAVAASLALQGTPRELQMAAQGGRIAWLQGEGPATELWLWRPADGVPPRAVHVGSARALAFSADGQRLQVRLGEAVVQAYDAMALKPAGRIESPEGARLVSAAFLGEGTQLALAAQRQGQQELRIHDTSSGALLARVPLSGPWLPWPEGADVAIRGADGVWRKVAPSSASADEILSESGTPVLRRPGVAARLVADMDDAAWAALPAAARRWISRPDEAGVNASAVRDVDAAGERLLVARQDAVAVVDAADGRQIAHWPDVRLAGEGPADRLFFIDRGNGVVALESRGVGTDRMHSRLWFWRWVDGPAREIGDGNPVGAITATPDGRWIASGEGALAREGDPADWRPTGRAQLRLWDGRTGQVQRTLPFDAPVEAVAFSPSGARVAARSGETVVVFDTETGDEVARFPTEPSADPSASGVAFAGESLLFASVDGGMQPMSLLPGEVEPIPSGGAGRALIDTSPGGRYLLAHDDSGLLGLWSTADGQRLVESVPARPPVSVWMPGDGDLLLLDGQGLRRLRWTAEALLAAGCHRAASPLTDAEWTRYLPDADRPGACDSR